MHKTQQLQICIQEWQPIARPYGELWGVYRHLYDEKWPRYIESALYVTKREFTPVTLNPIRW